MNKDNFEFAGFTWPRLVATLPRGTLAERIKRMREPRRVGPYYHAPKPIEANHGERGFYHGDIGMPELRWEWCDNVDGARIDHNGWYADAYGDTLIRGIVFRLPAGRGFLAGWSMGEGMAAEVDTDNVWTDERAAARGADSIAEHVAEREREYQERWQAALDADGALDEARAALADACKEWRETFHGRLDALAHGATAAALTLAAQCRMARDRFHDAAESLREARAAVEQFADVER